MVLLHDLAVAILATLIFTVLSIPYQFEFGYWAESPLLWAVYFFAGALVAVYIFYIFLQSWRHLLEEEVGAI